MRPDIPNRILVVDDSLILRRFCRAEAEALGVDVVEAANGVEALEVGLGQPIGLMLVDLNMPTMDGHRFLHEARLRPELADVPAVMISTTTRDADRLKSFASGANYYRAKPLQAVWLRQVITHLVGARHV